MNYDPLHFEERPLFEKLRLRRFITGAVLAAEDLTARLLPGFLWVAVFSTLWLLGLPAAFGKTASYAVSLAFYAGLLFFAIRGLRGFSYPDWNAIDRRLEKSSALQNRPLSFLDDKLANPQNPVALSLWQAHRDAMLENLHRLKTPHPLPVLSGRDPRAWRALAVIAIVIGLVIAGPQSSERLISGLVPFSATVLNGQDALTLWITPPAYTGQEEIVLSGKHLKREEPLAIPEGSTIRLRLNGGWGRPVAIQGKQREPLQRNEKKQWSLETAVRSGTSLKVRQLGFTRLDLPYQYIADAPPSITLAGEVKPQEKGVLQIPLKVRDDYGVADLHMTLTLDPVIEDKPLGHPFTETRAVMSPPLTEIEIKPSYDLAWHPWAGLPVDIILEAQDQKGQRAATAPLTLTLPERAFRNPVAIKLIALRKAFAWTPESLAPATAAALRAILDEPETFNKNPIVALSLSSMIARLGYPLTGGSAARLIEQLWDTALQIEEGNLALAARTLRESQSKLEALLNNPNASDEELAQALDEFRQALGQYFQELMQELQKQMAEGKMVTLPEELFSTLTRPEDLERFLDELTQQALSGDRQDAREMLSKLQQLMDQLDPSTGQMQMSPDMQFKMESVSELQQLIEKQQALLDQTMIQAEKSEPPFSDPPPPEPGMPFDREALQDLWSNLQKQSEKKTSVPVDTSAYRDEQEALRFILGQLMKEAGEILNEIPEPLGLAELEMRGSSKALGDNRPATAIPHQEKALEYLRQTMNQMSEQVATQLRQMMALSLGGGKTDPLGRPLSEGEGPSWLPSSRVQIPDEAQRKKVKEILDILRKRAGEYDRPAAEREYYRRLMKQF